MPSPRAIAMIPSRSSACMRLSRTAGSWCARFFQEFQMAWVVDARTGEVMAPLSTTRHAGLFVGRLETVKKRFPYRLRVQSDRGTSEVEDPYRFPPVLSDLDVHLLAEGTHLSSIRDVRGASSTSGRRRRRRFRRMGAERAARQRRRPVQRLGRPPPSDAAATTASGMWEISFPASAEGDFTSTRSNRPGEMLRPQGRPVALAFEASAAVDGLDRSHDRSRSRVARRGWLAERRAPPTRRDAPISIYEVHLGSWRRGPQEGNRYPRLPRAGRPARALRQGDGLHARRAPADHGASVRRIVGLSAARAVRADQPLRHARRFRPSSTRCHDAGLGVILDWVPAHFPDRSARPRAASTARISTSTPTRAWAGIPTGAR